MASGIGPDGIGVDGGWWVCDGGEAINIDAANDNFRDMLLTARKQAGLAIALYAGRDALNDFARETGAVNCAWCEDNHIVAGWVKYKDHVHLSICGSNDLYDWAQNASGHQVEVFKTETSDGFLAHAGFARSAESLRYRLESSGLISATLIRPLVIGGHSAGGAIAELLALAPGFNTREVVTFGAPRVFAAESAAPRRTRPCRTHRFTALGDPIPGLPLRRFRWLFGGAQYSHPSPEMQLCFDGSVLMDQSGSVRHWLSMASSVWLHGRSAAMRLLSKAPPDVTSNHSIMRYADYLDTAIVRYQK